MTTPEHNPELTVESEPPKKIPPLERDTRFYALLSEHHDRVDHRGVLDYLEYTARNSHDKNVYSVASDMDGTMFDSDLGTSLFCIHAFDPTFWLREKYDFKEALMSEDFVNGLAQAAKARKSVKKDDGYSIGEENGDIYIEDYREVAKWIMNVFVPAIIDLYKSIRMNVRFYGIEGQRKEIEKFVAYFHILHLITIKMEPVFNLKNSGKIIPLTRMLAGWSESEIREVADPMFSMEQNSPNREFKIRDLDLSLFADVPGLQLSSELLTTPISLRANKVLAVKRLYRQIVDTRAGIINVITTNLPLTAEIAVSKGPYKKMFDIQSRRFKLPRRKVIHGSKLAEANGEIFPFLDGPAVLAEQKQSRVQLLDRTYETLVASGDTPTDRLMWFNSLANGGIAIVVGRNIEETRARFEKFFKDHTANERARVFFAEQSSVYSDDLTTAA